MIIDDHLVLAALGGWQPSDTDVVTTYPWHQRLAQALVERPTTMSAEVASALLARVAAPVVPVLDPRPLTEPTARLAVEHRGVDVASAAALSAAIEHSAQILVSEHNVAAPVWAAAAALGIDFSVVEL